MKKAIFFISLSVILIIIDIFLIFGNKSKKENKEVKTDDKYITITQYKFGTDKIIKKIKITTKEDIKKLNNYKKELKPLEELERVAISIPQEINIKYDDNVLVGISLSEKNYCYYEHQKEKISDLSHIPKGLYDFVVNKLK